MSSDTTGPLHRPIGPIIDLPPAKRPERVTLAGRFITLTPLEAASHADALFDAANGGEKDQVWDYLFDGPYTDREAFRASIEAKAKLGDPLFFAIVDNVTGKPVTWDAVDPSEYAQAGQFTVNAQQLPLPA